MSDQTTKKRRRTNKKSRIVVSNPSENWKKLQIQLNLQNKSTPKNNLTQHEKLKKSDTTTPSTETNSQIKSQSKSNGETNSQIKSKSESNGEKNSQIKLKSESNGETNSQTNSQSKSNGEKNLQIKSQSKSNGENSQTKSQSKSNGEKNSQIKSQSKSNGETNSQIKSKSESNVETNLQIKFQSKSNGETNLQIKSKSESNGETNSQIKPQSKSNGEKSVKNQKTTPEKKLTKFEIQSKILMDMELSENLEIPEKSTRKRTEKLGKPPGKPPPPLEQQNQILENKHKLAPSSRDTRPTKVLALDCEMVGVGPDGVESALARVTIVNTFGNVLYDKIVMPIEPVTDFRTKYSGITEESLVNAFPFDVVQKEVAALIKGRIVVGHALKNDFKALMLFHPLKLTRDTARYGPLQRARGRPHALRHLTRQMFGVVIQKGEHDSAEDARAALLVYKHLKVQWERTLNRHLSSRNRRQLDQDEEEEDMEEDKEEDKEEEKDKKEDDKEDDKEDE